MRVSARFQHWPPSDRRVPHEHRAEEHARVLLPAVIDAAPRGEPAAPSTRPAAALVAQLLAQAEDMPATRARRRLEPAAGAEIYRAMAGFGPAVAPRATRSV